MININYYILAAAILSDCTEYDEAESLFYTGRKKKVYHDSRYELVEHILDLQKQGMKCKDIAKQLGISLGSCYTYISKFKKGLFKEKED